MYNGIINIYKEAGFTSFDVIAKLRGILKQKKIGHTGTLDPEAVGVLPVCVGNGTRLCDLLMDHDKEYEAVLQLGIMTDTQDLTGRVLLEQEVCCSEEEIREAAAFFVGGYEQIPPMYSALKVNGKKLYELARQGVEIERKARPVAISKIEILSIELPFVKIRVHCGKGTYIRTLIQDMGDRLGCSAAMKSLVRTKVGTFSIENAKTLAQMEQLQKEDRIKEVLIPVDAMFPELPKRTVKPEFQKLLDNGNALEPAMFETDTQMEQKQGEEILVYSREGRFFGIFAYREEKGRYCPVKMFMEA